MHVSSRWGVEAIARRDRAGCRSTARCCTTTWPSPTRTTQADDGLLYHNYPPLKSPDDQDALWAAIESGDLDTVASDDFTIPRSSKLSGLVVDNVPGGHNGIETRMDVLFSEGVATNRLPIERYAKVTSEAPARLFGLYPRKGTIAIGSDADFAVIDPNARQTLRLDELHSSCDYSLWDGWQLRGKVRATVAHGPVLMHDGELGRPRRSGPVRSRRHRLTVTGARQPR